MKDFYLKLTSRGGAAHVTVASVRGAIQCTEFADEHTSEWFCRCLVNVPFRFNSVGCDAILAAGGIPVLFDLIRRWPTTLEVVLNACIALNNIAAVGSPAVKTAMMTVPGFEALLRSAKASGLAVDGRDGRSIASAVLAKLGLA